MCCTLFALTLCSIVTAGLPRQSSDSRAWYITTWSMRRVDDDVLTAAPVAKGAHVAALQSSLRVDKGGGVPGRTMADWLIDVGIDQPRTDRAASDRVPLLFPAPQKSCIQPQLQHSGRQAVQFVRVTDR